MSQGGGYLHQLMMLFVKVNQNNMENIMNIQISFHDIEEAEKRLLPCPFCGKKFEIFVTDEEGNARDYDYLKDPWSGIGFDVYHESPDCPIGFGYDTPMSGGYMSLEGLVEAMNKRNTQK